MKTGIYTITNKITKHIYVGAASNITKRLNNHLLDLRKNVHDNSYLQSSFNKYGEESFMFELLEECEIEHLYSQEHYWCNMLNTHDRNFGYNLKPTHPDNFSLVTEETRIKLKEKATGRIWSEEYKQIFRENKLGIKHTSEHIEKAAIGKYKPILQFSKNGTFIKEWDSAIIINKTLNLNKAGISNCCLGRSRTSGGFIWKYKDRLDTL